MLTSNIKRRRKMVCLWSPDYGLYVLYFHTENCCLKMRFSFLRSRLLGDFRADGIYGKTARRVIHPSEAFLFELSDNTHLKNCYTLSSKKKQFA